MKCSVCVCRQQFNEKSLSQGYLQEVTSHLCRGRGMDIHSQAKVMWAYLINTLFISGFFPANRKRVFKHSLTHTFISLSQLSHTNKCPFTKELCRCQLTYCTCDNGSCHRPLRKTQTSSKAPSIGVFLPTGIHSAAASPERERKRETEHRDPLLREHPFKTSTWPLCACMGANVASWVCAFVFMLWVSLHVYMCVLQDAEPPTPHQMAPRDLQGRVCYCEMV